MSEENRTPAGARPANVAEDGVSPLCTVCDAPIDLGFYLHGFKEGRHRYCVTPEETLCLAVCWECYYNPERTRRLISEMTPDELARRYLGKMGEQNA